MRHLFRTKIALDGNETNRICRGEPWLLFMVSNGGRTENSTLRWRIWSIPMSIQIVVFTDETSAGGLKSK